MGLTPSPADARAFVLAAAALLLVPVGPAVGWAVAEALPCAGPGCAFVPLLYVGAPVFVVGVVWGFLLRRHKEAWAPALTGLLSPLAFLS